MNKKKSCLGQDHSYPHPLLADDKEKKIRSKDVKKCQNQYLWRRKTNLRNQLEGGGYVLLPATKIELEIEPK